MKTLGLIGGTSWLSTVDYYRVINQEVNERLGDLNSARLILYSMNMEEFKPPPDPNDWWSVENMLTGIAQKLEDAGAQGLVICANTPHIFAEAIQKKISIPIIHIAEATAAAIKKVGQKKVGLLGTKPTMEMSFYKDILMKHGIESVIPDEEEREFIHHSIFTELSREIFKQESKVKYFQIFESLRKKGAEGMILGCTEIPLLIKQHDSTIPLFDTTVIHAMAAVEFALGG